MQPRKQPAQSGARGPAPARRRPGSAAAAARPARRAPHPRASDASSATGATLGRTRRAKGIGTAILRRTTTDAGLAGKPPDGPGEQPRAAAYPAMDAPHAVFDRRLLRRRRDRAAATRTGSRPMLEAAADRLLDRLDDTTRRFQRALEIGGRGLVAPALRARGVGQRWSRWTCPPAWRPRAGGDAVAGDEEWLPFAAGSFDLVVAKLWLHWVNDLPGALTQIRRAMAPDGLFLASLPGPRHAGRLAGGAGGRRGRPCAAASRPASRPSRRCGTGPACSSARASPCRWRTWRTSPCSTASPWRCLRDLRAAGETNAVLGARPAHAAPRPVPGRPGRPARAGRTGKPGDAAAAHPDRLESRAGASPARPAPAAPTPDWPTRWARWRAGSGRGPAGRGVRRRSADHLAIGGADELRLVPPARRRLAGDPAAVQPFQHRAERVAVPRSARPSPEGGRSMACAPGPARRNQVRSVTDPQRVLGEPLVDPGLQPGEGDASAGKGEVSAMPGADRAQQERTRSSASRCASRISIRARRKPLPVGRALGGASSARRSTGTSLRDRSDSAHRSNSHETRCSRRSARSGRAAPTPERGRDGVPDLSRARCPRTASGFCAGIVGGESVGSAAACASSDLLQGWIVREEGRAAAPGRSRCRR